MGETVPDEARAVAAATGSQGPEVGPAAVAVHKKYAGRRFRLGR